MSTVAITGATGFVGSSLVRSLISQGMDIIALVRPDSPRQVLDGLEVSWVEGDITDPSSLRDAFSGADLLIHAAGLLGQAGIPEKSYQKVHVDGTRHVLAAAAGCSRILHISSPGVLGPITGPPADETAPRAPSNAYERSKAAAEEVALSFAREGAPVVVARPEFIYGPGDRHVLGLFQAVQRGRFFYISGGHTSCHPTYIEDATDGLIRCLSDGAPGEIYHITGPNPVTFRELGRRMAAALDVREPWLSLPRSAAWLGALALETGSRITGKKAPLSRSGVAFFSENRRFSWEKARQALDYRPQYELQDGLRLTVDWYRQQGLL
jgi:dihydroflavonol-4-reductase